MKNLISERGIFQILIQQKDIDTTKIEIDYTLFKILPEGYYKSYKNKTLVIHK